MRDAFGIPIEQREMHDKRIELEDKLLNGFVKWMEDERTLRYLGSRLTSEDFAERNHDRETGAPYGPATGLFLYTEGH